jgi:mersacidin/lichenicidin family type 2 lantibiotic
MMEILMRFLKPRAKSRYRPSVENLEQRRQPSALPGVAVPGVAEHAGPVLYQPPGASITPRPMHIIRAWKDAEYRRSLSGAEQAQLPANPAGTIDLTDAELGPVAGGINAEGTETCWINELIPEN